MHIGKNKSIVAGSIHFICMHLIPQSASVARCIQPSLMVLSRQPVAVGASESHLVVVNGDFGDSSTLQKESLPFV